MLEQGKLEFAATAANLSTDYSRIKNTYECTFGPFMGLVTKVKNHVFFVFTTGDAVFYLSPSFSRFLFCFFFLTCLYFVIYDL